MQQILMSSAKDNWETPKELYELLDSIFHFSLDAAASEANAKCSNYITEEQNALKTDWKEYMIDCGAQTNTVWLNPPYGARSLNPFLKKVEEEYKKGLTVVTLTAARTETKFFRTIWENARYLNFIYKRLSFEINGVPIGTATFPSVVSVFTSDRWSLWKLNSIGHLIEQNIITPRELKTIE